MVVASSRTNEFLPITTYCSTPPSSEALYRAIGLFVVGFHLETEQPLPADMKKDTRRRLDSAGRGKGQAALWGGSGCCLAFQFLLAALAPAALQ